MSRSTWLSSLLLALAPLACGDGGSSPDAAARPDTPVTPLDTAPVSPFCTSKPAVAVTDLSGTWVLRLAAAQIVIAPSIGSIHVQSVYYLLLDLRQNGAEVVIDGRYCDRTEIDPPDALVPVIIPDAWAHTEKLIHRTGLFVPGTDGFPVLTLPPYVETAGAVLAPGEALPEDPTDHRVIDEDGDGNPGITVALSGQLSGRVFSVQQQTTSVSAIAVAPDRIEGALQYDSLQNVLASSPTNIASLYKLSRNESDPAVCNSSFAMVRLAAAPAVDGGAAEDGGASDGSGAGDGGASTTCAWVRANEAVLFP